MGSEFLTKAGKRLFAKNLEQYTPEDPLYEQYVDKKGRKKRRKRDIPPGLSARDAKILRSVRRRAHYLDKGFSMCGMKFGWAFIIGIIPGAGDVADIALNYYLVFCKAREAELPGWLVRRMLINNSISAVVGFVPFVGDIVLAQYKANSRNAALLEEFLRIRGEVYLKMKAEGKDVVQSGAPKPKEVAASKGQEKGKNKNKKDPAKDKQVKVDVGVEEKAKVPESATKSDTEQIKPGAGLVEGEVVPDTQPTIPVHSQSAVNPANPSSGGKPQGKRRLSFTLWRSKDNGKAKQVGDRGRFVEDLGNNEEASGGKST